MLTRYDPVTQVPIESRPCSAWIVEFRDGKKLLTLWAKDATITDIVRHYNAMHPGQQFQVTPVDVGEFTVSTEHSYSHDARRVDQDGYVLLKGYDHG